jgi:hypothetical protein
MKTMLSLGLAAGGFLLRPTPASNFVWLVCRSHPAVAVTVLVLSFVAWRQDNV